MDKAKIYSTGNENLSGDFNISYYIVEKDGKFLDWLEKLVAEVLNLKDGGSSVKYVVKEIKNNDGMPIGSEVYLKDIKKMIDVHEHYGDSGNRIDLFYGKDRVFITFRKSKETRKKFAKFIIKTKEWIVVKELPELPVYTGKRIQ